MGEAPKMAKRERGREREREGEIEKKAHWRNGKRCHIRNEMMPRRTLLD